MPEPVYALLFHPPSRPIGPIFDFPVVDGPGRESPPVSPSGGAGVLDSPRPSLFPPDRRPKSRKSPSSGVPRASKPPADNAGPRCATKCRCWRSACAWNVAYAERPAIDKGGGRGKGGRRRAEGCIHPLSFILGLHLPRTPGFDLPEHLRHGPQGVRLDGLEVASVVGISAHGHFAIEAIQLLLPAP